MSRTKSPNKRPLEENRRPEPPPGLSGIFEADPEEEKAKSVAFRLLERKSYTEREILSKLRSKGFLPRVVESTGRRLVELGLIDDEAFAGRFVRDRLRFRPMGRGLLSRDLRLRGVDPQLADKVLDETLAETDPQELALDLLRSRRNRYFSLDRSKAFSRMSGFLGRRGFPFSVVKEAVDRVWAEFEKESSPEGRSL